MGSSRRIEKYPQSGWGCMGGGATDHHLEGNLYPASFGQNRPPRLTTARMAIKLDRSLKKRVRKQSVKVEYLIQAYINIWDQNSDWVPVLTIFLGLGVFVVEVGLFPWFQINWTYTVHFIQFLIILFWLFSEFKKNRPPQNSKPSPFFTQYI